jgi:hypothetical protein
VLAPAARGVSWKYKMRALFSGAMRAPRPALTGLLTLTTTVVLSFMALATSTATAAPRITHSTASAARSDAEKDYLRLIQTANGALLVFYAESIGWSRGAPMAVTRESARDLTQALTALEHGLMQERWPAPVIADVVALSEANHRLLRDLGRIGSLDQAGVAEWRTEIAEDMVSFTMAGTSLRNDLNR